MSNEKKILKGYDDYIEGKKTLKTTMILVIGFSLIVVITCLVLNFLNNVQTADKVKVIDSTGRAIPSEVKRKEEVLIATAQQHISNSMFFLNTFDRNTINENQAKAYFLVEKKSADRVFASFNTTGAYNDAIRNGVAYKTEFTKLTKFEGESEPFYFEAEGILTVTSGSNELKNIVEVKGKLRYTTPSFPTNPQGFIIYDYLQNFKAIDNE